MNAIAKAVLEACLRGSLGLKLQDVKRPKCNLRSLFKRLLEKQKLENGENDYALYYTLSRLTYRKMVSQTINNNTVGFRTNIEHYAGEV